MADETEGGRLYEGGVALVPGRVTVRDPASTPDSRHDRPGVAGRVRRGRRREGGALVLWALRR